MNRKRIKLVAYCLILGFVFSNQSLATGKIIVHPNSEELLDELNIARDLKQKKHDHFEINKWKPSFRKILEENGKKMVNGSSAGERFFGQIPGQTYRSLCTPS